MKILPCNPKTLAGHSSLDDSRLGNHVEPVSENELGKSAHGIVILGFADDTGIQNVGGRTGAKEGPAALRKKLYRFTTGKPGIPVYDLGDLLPQETIEKTHEAATKLCRAIHESGHVPVLIGGGHDFGFPPALALLEAEGGSALFCNIDAHLDVRPAQPVVTSGSPWYLLREHPLYQKSKSRIEEFGLQPHCNASSLVSYAIKHKFGLHWLSDIRKKGSVGKQFSALLKKPSRHKSVLVSFDIDSVQWPDAPGCSAPQTLGFTAAEAILMSRLAGENGKVKSFGVFELSPPLDPDGRTATLAAHCINAFLQGREARNFPARRAKIKG
jgi:formiminoglutamase